MQTSARTLFALACAGSSLLVPLAAQDASATFAAPVRLKAGDEFLGHNRLYPSPVYHDVNGDGLADIVVGDLRGHLTVALRKTGDPIAFEAEAKLTDRHGKDIDFHNW
jgi:hypothetical protein